MKVVKTGWSEPAATNAPVEDQAVQAALGMNQKCILPCPKFLVFSASSLPSSPLLPISHHFALTPSSEFEAGATNVKAWERVKWEPPSSKLGSA
jgi:hypothetical protein